MIKIICFTCILIVISPLNALSKWEIVHNLYTGTISSFGVIDSNIITYSEDGIHFSKDYGETWDPDQSNGKYGWGKGMKPEFFVADKYLFKFYSIMGSETLFRIEVSIDYGKTWIYSYDYIDFYGGNESRIMLTVKDSIIYATVNNFLLKSDNYGKSWDKLDNTPHIFSLTGTHNGLYIINNQGVFFSIDNAISWTKNDFLSELKVTRIFEFGKYQYAIDNMCVIYISSDTGNSWQKLSDRFFPNKIISISNLDSILFITTLKDGVFKSTDNGLTWLQVTLLQEGSNSFTKESFFINYSGKLYSTNDKGNTFILLFQGYVKAYTHSLVSNSNVLYALSNRGVFLSSNYGLSWIDINDDLKVVNHYINSALCGFAVDSILYVGFADGNGVCYSSNFGINWKQLIEVPTHVTSLLIKDSLIYAGLWMYCMMFSSNNGMTWQHKGCAEKSSNIYSILKINNKLLIGSTGDECGIYIYEDSSDFYQKTLSLSRDDFILDLIQIGNRIFACSNKSGIYTSSDEGKSWESRNNGLNGTVINSIITKDNCLFAATSNGVYYSIDSALNWVEMNEGLGVYPVSLAIAGKYLFVTSAWRDFYRSLLSDYGLSDISEMSNKNSFTTSPNPASDFIEIQNPKNKVIEIINLYGQIQNTQLLSETISYQGEEKVRIDVSHLARGMYFIRIEEMISKFIKI